MAQIVDVLLPTSQQEGTESLIGRWLKKVGESVTIHEPIAEINTDKVTLEIAAPATGTLLEIIRQENDYVNPGDLLARIELGEPVQQDSGSINLAPGLANTTEQDQNEYSPAVRQVAREHRVDLKLIRGSGRDGRITVDDVLKHISRMQSLAGGSPSAPPTVSTRRIPHSPVRRSIAKNMVESMLHTAPHVTAVFEMDLTAVTEHRKRHEPIFAKQGVKLTLTPYFVSATCTAIAAVPEVNSRWHDDYLELFEDCNIGIATAVEDELFVPVLRRAQTLNLLQTASSLQDLKSRAREGKLQLADVQGGTFTITNHGVSGSLIATPIILQPQSAILGIGKIAKHPVVVERSGIDEIVIRPHCFVTLTIDHRALDGAATNKFLTTFVKVIEQWPLTAPQN